jgi:hypothetical protein
MFAPSSPSTGSPDDPRPVFDGDWSKATGPERQAHRTRVNAWYGRHPEARPSAKRSEAAKAEAAAPQSGMGARDEEQVAHLRVLQAVIDAPKSLASDRIRAVEARERILQRVEEEAKAEAYAPLVALRHALDALPSEARADALSALLLVR